MNPGPVADIGFNYTLDYGSTLLNRGAAGCYRIEIMSARCIKDKAEQSTNSGK